MIEIRKFLTGERTEEGFYRITGGLDCAIARGLAYSKYADLFGVKLINQI